MADDQVQDIANQQERLERARANHLHDLAAEIAAEIDADPQRVDLAHIEACRKIGVVESGDLADWYDAMFPADVEADCA